MLLNESAINKTDTPPAVDELVSSCLVKFSEKAKLEFDAHHRLLCKSGCTSAEARYLLGISKDEVEKQLSRTRSHLERVLAVAVSFLSTLGEHVVSVKPLLADSHNDIVPISITTDKQRYVLKYGDVMPWSILEEPLKYFSGKTIPIIPLLMDGHTHGWYLRPWISSSTNAGNPERQARGFGAMCALAMYFNICDLHFENYVVGHDFVLPIDLECTFYDYPNNQWSFNVLLIGIIGYFFGASAVNGEGRFQQYSEPYLADGLITFKRENLFNEHHLRDKRGQIVRLLDYLPNFCEGWREAIAYARTNEHLVSKVATQEDWLSRKIFRPTSFYRLLLSEMTVYGFSMRNHIFRQRMRIAGDAALFPRLPVFEWEKKQLHLGNIPIFHVSVITGRVWSGYRETNYFISVSPIARWHRKTELLTEKRAESCLNQLVALIRHGLNRSFNSDALKRAG